MNNPIYHLASVGDAEDMAKNDQYRAASLDSEGFIHCCTSSQLPGVITRYYISATELVLLSINTELLTSELVHENTVGGTELFPHVYGAINTDAIVKQTRLDAEQIADIASMKSYQP